MGVAEALNHMALTNKIEALAVVAAHKTLGQLRKHWHKALEERLVGEIPKALAGRPAEDIAEAISRA
ncbi:Protein required for attachment to host cell [compost metagenome]